MNKYRLGWPDLLLVAAFVPAVTGHFYWAMALLAVYGLLYHRATHRRRGYPAPPARLADLPRVPSGPAPGSGRLTREDVARIFDVPLDLLISSAEQAESPPNGGASFRNRRPR